MLYNSYGMYVNIQVISMTTSILHFFSYYTVDTMYVSTYKLWVMYKQDKEYIRCLLYTSDAADE